MTFPQAVVRFVLIWFVFALVLWSAGVAVWKAPTGAEELSKLGALGLAGAICVSLVVAFVYNRGHNDGAQEVRITELPAARDQGRLRGREEMLDITTEQPPVCLENLPDGEIFEVGERIRSAVATTECQVILEGDFGSGSRGEGRLVRMPTVVADHLDKGGRYRYRADGEPSTTEGEPLYFERVG
jgi:hypothetical protein